MTDPIPTPYVKGCTHEDGYGPTIVDGSCLVCGFAVERPTAADRTTIDRAVREWQHATRNGDVWFTRAYVVLHDDGASRTQDFRGAFGDLDAAERLISAHAHGHTPSCCEIQEWDLDTGQYLRHVGPCDHFGGTVGRASLWCRLRVGHEGEHVF